MPEVSREGVHGSDPSRCEWSETEENLFNRLRSSAQGLSTGEANERMKSAAQPLGVQRTSGLQLIGRQFRNPIVMILLGVAVVSIILGEPNQSAIVIGIVALSAALGFIQERGAMHAVHSLMKVVTIHADALRDGSEHEVLVSEIVRGDVVVLRAGDVVPGDGRVIYSHQLQLDEAALTGESFPSRKFAGIIEENATLSSRSNMVHLGTYVASGEGRVLITRTGVETEFGQIVGSVAEGHLPTSFERGVTDFGYMLMRAMVVLVVGIFVVNIFLNRAIVESVLFSLALAVGLTPQMLPAIVTLSLSRGAISMAQKKVIVKRLGAIEDIGSLDILCTDKTGTITVGSVILQGCLDYLGRDAIQVGNLAWLTSRFQRGFSNPLDDAILNDARFTNDSFSYVDEVPFDFSRKRMSVVVASNSGNLFVSKGALEPLLEQCSMAETENGNVDLKNAYREIMSTFENLSDQGYRVLGVAYKSFIGDTNVSTSDETNLIFAGFITFSDPVKPGAREAISLLRNMGVQIRMITGDNRLAASYVARAIGLNPKAYATGSQLERMTDEELISFVEDNQFYVEIDPIQKARIVRAYSLAGHTVGFLGDGINDSPALHAADVGISVDGAVDIAKQTADLVLLNKDLSVLTAGIEQGRKIFANTLKYIHVTTSANFGNMLSLVVAAIFLPFIPLLPMQILLLNFLSDIPGISIATDNVDRVQIERPQKWNIAHVRSFMIIFGLVSTVFDLCTFAVLRLGFDASEMLLRSGWFIESMLTELAALLVLRTAGPVWRSRPGFALVIASAIVGVVTVALPYLPLAGRIGFSSPTAVVALSLFAISICYITATELAKNRFSHLLDASLTYFGMLRLA